MLPSELSQKLRTLEGAIVDRVMVMRVANQGLVIVRERTLDGKFLPGSSPGADQYSTKPFARPLGGLTAQHRNALLKSKSVTEFKKENGSIWIVVQGGYKEYRQLAGKDVSHVSLTWTGRMLRNLGILNADNSGAILGFKSAEEKQKALWHNSLGAGKSHRKHVFMGFTKDEEARLTKMVGEEIMKKMSVVL